MADIDPKKLKRGVLRDVLQQLEKGKDSSAFEKYASAQAAKAKEGKGLIGGAIAAQKAKYDASKEYAIATKGTLGRRQAFFEGLLGKDLGNLFKNLGLEKMESEERVKEARGKFGLDKKEKKERAGGGNLSKPISLILRNVIYVKKIVENIQKSLTKPTIKPGYSFDPRMAGGGRYRNVDTNKLVSAKEALQTRTDTLSTAIGADEQPLVKLKEQLDQKLKDLDAKKLHQDVSSIKSMVTLLLLKAGIEIPGRRNVPSPNKPGPNAPKPPGPETPKPPGPETPKTPGPETPKPPGPETPKPPGPGGPEVPKGEGKWGKVGKALKTGGKFLGKLSGVAAIGISAYEGYQGYTNAEENLGLQKGQQATTGQKIASAAGSVVSGLTFGLVDSGKASRFLAGMEENPMDADLEKYVRKKDAGVNLSGLKPEMKKRLAGLAYEYNQKTGQKIQVNSGYRDSKEQAELYAKFGPPRAAPPGRSRHESGLAVDINSTDADKAVQLGLMAKYGFTRPVPGETWHVEPVETAKKGGTPDNPVAPGAPVAVANAGGKPANPESGTKPPAALTKPTAPAAMTADASTTAPPAAPPPASGLNPSGGTAAPQTAPAAPAVASTTDPLATMSDGTPADSQPITASTANDPLATLSDGTQLNSNVPVKTDTKSDVTPVTASTDPLATLSDGTAVDSKPMVHAAKMIANEPVVADKPFSAAQMAAIGTSLSMGNQYSQDIMDKYNKQKTEKTVKASANTPASAPLTAQASTPNLTPVQNTTGVQAAQGSNELETQKMVAQATPPAPVVVNNNSGGGPQKPIEGPKTPLPKAPTRTSESSFARAISNDFSHPTAFTSAIVG